MDKAAGKAEAYKGDGGWLGFTDKYWASAVIPEQTAPIEARYTASGTAQPEDYQADFVGAGKDDRPGSVVRRHDTHLRRRQRGQHDLQLPVQYGIKKFNLMIDWGWFYFITQAMYWLIDTIYRYVGNFGVAILIVTVLVKLVFFPLANRSYQSMAKMKKIQPQIAALKDLYPDDKVKQQQEQMELFKREGVNPVAGCLPMVIQIPVFFALYKVIFITIEMRHAPFFGWIRDLSAPDPTNIFTLFGLIPWEPTAVPVIGHFLALGIWPLIMGFSMFLQMKMNPEPADPVQKTMFSWMPVIFTFMLGTFPAGLVIYWTWNNTLTVIQQYYIMKKAGVKVELWDNLVKLLARRPRRRAPKRRAYERGRVGDGLDGGRTEAVRRTVRFLFRRGALRRTAAGRAARGRLRRPFERRQVLAHQCADRPVGPRPHLAHARPDAGIDFFRSQRQGDAGRHAGLRLCGGRQGEVGLLGPTGAGLSARPAVAPARLRAGRWTPWAEGERSRDDAYARRRGGLLRRRADEARRGEGGRAERPGRVDARGLAQARRGLSGGAVHLGAQRRGRRRAARAYR